MQADVNLKGIACEQENKKLSYRREQRVSYIFLGWLITDQATHCRTQMLYN